jgi:hypothetical protein
MSTTHCDSCGEMFRVGDKIQQLPPILKLGVGEKSGELGWYPENNQTDFVHIECVQGFYQVENTPAWDDIEGNIRERVRQEEIQEIREEILQEIATDQSLICMECMEPLDFEEVQDIMSELGDRFLHEPEVYLARLNYTEAFDLYTRLGQALSRKYSQEVQG